jgi:hypothetical protein
MHPAPESDSVDDEALSKVTVQSTTVAVKPNLVFPTSHYPCLYPTASLFKTYILKGTEHQGLLG